MLHTSNKIMVLDLSSLAYTIHHRESTPSNLSNQKIKQKTTKKREKNVKVIKENQHVISSFQKQQIFSTVIMKQKGNSYKLSVASPGANHTTAVSTTITTCTHCRNSYDRIRTSIIGVTTWSHRSMFSGFAAFAGLVMGSFLLWRTTT
ncbi:hypothetical protein CIPAW_14G064500 [Carya illinoinensis]|uniref:Transmembrane protein n=1 Tax=Carya illinoinensis TaxID=32201 RepID=A0A8T1NK34_CARIL|nr:hypothetical protein CIPAW_14G064500 [Carya illinoinensis]